MSRRFWRHGLSRTASRTPLRFAALRMTDLAARRICRTRVVPGDSAHMTRSVAHRAISRPPARRSIRSHRGAADQTVHLTPRQEKRTDRVDLRLSWSKYFGVSSMGLDAHARPNEG